MGHSYFTYRGRSIRESDSAIEVSWNLLTEELSRLALTSEYPGRLADMAPHLWQNYRPQGAGMYGVDLDQYVQDENSRLLLIRGIDHLLDRLRQFGQVIPAAYLNDRLAAPGSAFKDMSTERLAGLLTTLRAYLQNRSLDNSSG